MFKRKSKAEKPKYKALSEYDIDVLRKQVAMQLWSVPVRLIFKDINDNPVMFLSGHYYEPYYEDFSSTCRVEGYDETGKKYILFDEDSITIAAYKNKTVVTGGEELIQEYIKNHNINVVCEYVKS